MDETRRDNMQRSATYDAVQCSAVQCTAVQHVAVQRTVQGKLHTLVQHTAAVQGLGTMQHLAAALLWSSLLRTPEDEHVATQCNTVQRVATQCSMLQHSTTMR